MRYHRPLLRLAAALLLPLLPLAAKNSEWSVTDGSTFKGEPSGVFGPFALFKTAGSGGKRLLMRQLPDAELQRFCSELAGKPALAPSWDKARGRASADFIGRLNELSGEKIIPVDFSKRAEPELLVLYFGSAWGGESYETSLVITAAYHRLKRLYGPRFEFVFLGVRHDKDGNNGIARAVKMPWLIADYAAQESLESFRNFAPAEGQRIVVISREGLPLAHSDVASIQATKSLLDELASLLGAADPANNLLLPDRQRLLAASRLLSSEKAAEAPVLLSHPLNTLSLAKAGISRIAASLKISAEGKVTEVNLDPSLNMPASWVPGAKKALASCVVLPALDKGKAVEGVLNFDLQVPANAELLELDRAWVLRATRPDLVIPSWLLLRPIPVPEGAFSRIAGVDESGVTQMTAFTVGTDKGVSHKSQMNAFNTDFFGEEGPSSVSPMEGQTQDVDGESYVWEKVASKDGFVDFANNKTQDFVVGYAYAEFDCAEAGPALFGLGSDDGVKIWLNGQLIKDSWTRRYCRIDDDLVPLRLQAGKNRLLIKIQNANGGWSFFARLRR